MAIIVASAALLAAGPAETQGPIERLFDRIRDEPEAPATPQPDLTRPIALPESDIPKDGNALRLLVIGDFMARGIANALDDAYADDPRIVVVDRTNGSSGLVRDDFYDWKKVLPDLLAEEQPDFLVLMIGTNDRQPMLSTEGRLDLRSEDWDRVYAERVDQLAASMAILGPRAFWVGQPPMRSRSMSADMAFFNSIYEDAAGRGGIAFVDIWDAFADEDGRFAVAGPDVAGQATVLRDDDGFSFTRSGRAKAAFFVQSEIQLAGDGFSRGFGAVPNGGGIEIQPDGTPRLVGPVLLLGAPRPGALGHLLTEPAPHASDSVVYRLLVRGDALPHVPGRVDDFSWPRDSQLDAAIDQIQENGAADALAAESAEGDPPEGPLDADPPEVDVNAAPNEDAIVVGE